MTPEEEKRFPRLGGLQVLKGILYPVLLFVRPVRHLIADQRKDHARKRGDGDVRPGSREDAGTLGPTCNVCGSRSWADQETRPNVLCTECGSLERTRAIKLLLDHHKVPASGARVLHFAPEAGLGRYLQEKAGAGYDGVDLFPDLFPTLKVRRFDLVADSPSLPDDHYDLILHSHVLEHVPCNIAHVLYHLYRALKPNGLHVFCVPLRPGHYDEYFGPMSAEEAVRRFGQSDHVRSFGVKDLERHLGLLVNINRKPSLYDTFDKATLDQCNIPERERTGLGGSTVFVTSKADFLLQPGSR